MKRPPDGTPCLPPRSVRDLTVTVCREGSDVIVTAERSGRLVGQAVAEAVKGFHSLKVGETTVVEGERRAGVGTALYEALVDVACRAGLSLSSDDFRSPYAEAFWRKQASKGRAVCTGSGGSVYRGPVRKLTPEDRARLPVPVTGPDPASGRYLPERWPCARYVVRAPCETPSLGTLPRVARPRARVRART